MNKLRNRITAKNHLKECMKRLDDVFTGRINASQHSYRLFDTFFRFVRRFIVLQESERWKYHRGWDRRLLRRGNRAGREIRERRGS